MANIAFVLVELFTVFYQKKNENIGAILNVTVLCEIHTWGAFMAYRSLQHSHFPLNSEHCSLRWPLRRCFSLQRSSWSFLIRLWPLDGPYGDVFISHWCVVR